MWTGVSIILWISLGFSFGVFVNGGALGDEMPVGGPGDGKKRLRSFRGL